MTFPQPNADAYALNGQQYFRLNTLLSSPGDIYESAQGALAFAMGPDSDIARVRISYFDDQGGPTKTNETVIDPRRSFVGRVDARNETTYQPSNRPGRILLWPDDLFDPTYIPTTAVTGFNPGTDALITIVPRLDVIQYFVAQQSLQSRRADKEYNSQSYDPTANLNYIIVPTYGRKYGFCDVINKDLMVASTFKVIGINYSYNPLFTQETVIFSAPLPSNAHLTVNNFLGPSGAGMFDACIFTVRGSLMPLRIYLSDEV